jgi:uncharacterized protein YjbI with pentapeptide repeats
MANPDHLKTLLQGVDVWNAWRQEQADAWNARRQELVEPNLCKANLSKANLSKANLSEANLNEANLSKANLIDANLSEANLSAANLSGANLFRANLNGAKLMRADLSRADLSGAHLRFADLSGADLSAARLTFADLGVANLGGADLSRADLAYAGLIDADITEADLTGCRIYGISAWGLKLSDETRQRNLIITKEHVKPEITVDNIEVAQFIYLLLHNQKIRNVIDTIISKVVLILGSFKDERKAVLEALRDDLRQRDLVPILFDFDKPTSLSRDETITLLARMARLVIADISDAKSVLQELRAIVPDVPSVLVQPVIIAWQEEPGMFDFFRRFPWFLRVLPYDTPGQLLTELSEVIKLSETKALEFRATTAATSLNLERDSLDH